jgi:heptaprenyl diphosphate synthase
LRLFSSAGAEALDQPLEDRFYYLAAAVELLHLATLIHDDVVDDSDTRRGRPTLNSLYGDRDAVLLGDLLFARCFALVAKHATLKNAQAMATAVSRICDGEVAEAINDRGLIPSARRYVRRVAAKTALLFALSFQVGADEAGANERQVEAFRRAGYNVGVAFQIIDDVLDLTGDTSVVGKTTGSDLLQGVVTLPVVLAMQNEGTGVLRQNVESVLTGEGDVRAVADMVAAHGGVTLAKQRAAQYSRRAIAEVGRAASTPARGVLEKVSLELTARAY